jgi:undecaprenyl-diphosphatase
MLAIVLSAKRSGGVRVVVWVSAAVMTLVVGTSRFYLGAHWLTDVLAGYALGAAWIAFVAAISLLAMDQGRRPATLPTTGLSRRSGPGAAPKRDRMAQYG